MIEIVRTFSNVKKLEDYIRWLQDNSRTPDEFYGKLEKLAGCKANGMIMNLVFFMVVAFMLGAAAGVATAK